MEINKDTLNKISNMSGNELKDAISAIADSLGASPSQKRMALNNVNLIKRKLGSMSEKDISKYLSKLPQDKLEELKGKINL